MRMNLDYTISGTGIIATPASTQLRTAAAEAYRSAHAPATTGVDPVVQKVYSYANIILKLLAGLPQPARSYAVYQTYHETSAYSSPLFLQHNNASGIMYAGQHGAKKGANGYAYFDSLQDWATAFKHELTKKSDPAGATSLEDYNNRLVANKYYTDSPSTYLAGMKRARLVLKQIPAADRANATQDQDIPGSVSDKTDKLTDLWNSATTAEKVGAGIVAAIVLIKIAQ